MRVVVLFSCASAAMMLGSSCGPKPLAPLPGMPEYQELALVRVPGGHVNTAGGNLYVSEVDLEIDVRLGRYVVRRVWNSAEGAWRWNFDTRFDGTTFVDSTGAEYDVSGLSSGDAIPGTIWVYVSPTEVKTKGGRLFEFDANGDFVTMRWTSSLYPRLQAVRSPQGDGTRVDRIEQCIAAGSCTTEVTVDYGAGGEIEGVTDRAGRAVEYGYTAGVLTLVKSPFDLAEGLPGKQYSYDESGRLFERTTSDGDAVEYSYRGISAGVTFARQRAGDGSVHEFRYTARNAESGLFRTTYFDPTGAIWVYDYDLDQQVERIENGEGESETFEWTDKRVTRHVAAWGGETVRVFLNDDVVTETLPSGNVVQTTYRPDAVDRSSVLRTPVEHRWDSVGDLELRSYDAQGRLESQSNGEGEATLFAYDSEEMISSVTSPDGVSVLSEDYGVHGHATTLRFGAEVETLEYDAVGNLVRGGSAGFPAGPELGGVLARTFDGNRELASVSLSDLVVPGTPRITDRPDLLVERRSDGGRAAIRRPFGGDTEFIRDELGRVTERRERVSGAWESTLFEYDAGGRITAMERPNGMRQEVDYDGAGRRTQVTLKRNGAVESQVTFLYENGLLVESNDSTYPLPETYLYDQGRVSEITFGNGERLIQGHDLRSRITSQQYVSSTGTTLRTLGLEYDDANRLVRVSDGGATLLVADYVDGQLVREEFGNGLERVYLNDEQGLRQSSVIQGVGGGAQVAFTGFTWGACSAVPVSTEEDCVSWTVAAAPAIPFVEGYSLKNPDDGGLRLALVGDGSPVSRAYSYDALSNLLAVEDVDAAGIVQGDRVAMAYNAERNRVLSASVEPAGQPPTVMDYTWDSAGFATSRGGSPITWTAGGKIAAMGSALQHTWDAGGRPVSRTLNGEVTEFRFGGRVEADAAGVPEWLDLGPVRISLIGTEQVYRHLDARNNVRYVTDESGAVATIYKYDGYGVSALSGDEVDDQTFATGTQELDVVWLEARVHDPVIGRFLSPDPRFQLINQYSYTLGNPFGYWDPDGRQSVSIRSRDNPTTKVKIGFKIKGIFVGIEIETEGPGEESIEINAADDGDGADDGSDGNSSGGDGGDSGGSSDGGDGGEGDGGGQGDTTTATTTTAASTTCSPASLQDLPDTRRWLAVLLPVQLGLGLWVLWGRSRRRESSGTGG
ncbi:MAG: hypothetical protein MJE66_24540 [Proteobacteria bacterium]|nr:hypothetical protein [Pseudomonadota bacterium]